MKLRELINEELILKDVRYAYYGKNFITVDIFKNPSLRILKESDSRALKTIDGKIYTVVSRTDGRSLIHKDIVNILVEENIIPEKYKKNWWKDLNSLEDFVCIFFYKGKWKASGGYVFLNPSQLYKEEREKLEKFTSKYINVKLI